MNLIFMDSKDFVTKFAKEFDPKKYQYAIISRDIKVEEMMNGATMNELLPPAERVLTHFVKKGMCKQYKKAYQKFLQEPECEEAISVIISTAIRYKNDLIVMCSQKEADYQYLDILAKWIQKVYGFKPLTCDKYMKNPERKFLSKKEREEILIIDDKIRRRISGKVKSKGGKRSAIFEVKGELEKASKKELKRLAIDMGYRKEKLKDLEKKELIKMILDRTRKKKKK